MPLCRASLAHVTAVATLAAIAAAPVVLCAAVVDVPRQERTVASAMLRAAPGDTIAVEPGHYFGPIDLKPNVRLVGLRGPAQTSLLLETPEPVLRSSGGGPATALVGFTLSGSGTGVEIGKGALQIWDCRFEGDLKVGLDCLEGSRVRVFASEFKGLPVAMDARSGSELLVMHNDIVGNSVGLRAGAEAVRVYRNEFLRNGVAIDVLAEGSATVGGLLRDANGFLANGGISLRNRGTKPVAATLNFWGTVDCDSVAARLEGPVVYLPMAVESRKDSLTCP